MFNYYRIIAGGLYESMEKYDMEKLHELFVVDEHGNRTAVLLPLEKYEKLITDLHDLSVAAERRDEEVIEFEELRKRLKSDGFI